MALGVWLSNLRQEVESHLPIEELRLQRTNIQQLGGLPGQLAHGLAPQGRHSQVGGDTYALDIQQTPQWREHHRQVGRRRAWAAHLERFLHTLQYMRIGLGHHLWRLLGGQCTRQINQGAARRRGARGETQGDRGARRKERQLDFTEVELINLPHPHVLATKRHRCTGRVAACQQIQGTDREIQLFEDLHQGFANGTGGADHGDIKGLGHGGCLGHCGGIGTLPGDWG
ncbi:hypothetical protein PS682_05601 [Pseudomonas fluorescens]|nr:hypothetical protein PS682_05601 [Pseudomonas fluorescens]